MTPRIMAILVGAIVAFAGEKSPPTVPSLNQKVVDFALDHLGKRVGDGSCITLATAALASAGARAYPLDDPHGDYVWGTEIKNSKDALPGDVLQFRDAVFKGKKRLPKRRWISWHQSYPHHTAIVAEVSEGGKVLEILHQNVGGEGKSESDKKVVQETTLRIDSLQPGGWVRIYRPVPGVRRRADSEQTR